MISRGRRQMKAISRGRRQMKAVLVAAILVVVTFGVEWLRHLGISPPPA